MNLIKIQTLAVKKYSEFYEIRIYMTDFPEQLNVLHYSIAGKKIRIN